MPDRVVIAWGVMADFALFLAVLLFRRWRRKKVDK